MDYNEYIKYLIEQQINKNQNLPSNSFDNYNNKLNSIDKIGKNVSSVGKLAKQVNNPTVQKFGTAINNVGNNISNGTNIFKGVASKPFDFMGDNIGSLINGGTATAGSTGGAVGSVGTGTGATAGTATGASTGAATTATTGGATAAGSTTASGAAGSSAAAGGTAASGSAAGSALAGGIAALAVMALMGNNRKRVKKAGNQLLDMTNNLVANGNADSEQNLANLQQQNKNLQQVANNSLSQGILTGGAAPIHNNYIQENAPSLGYEGSATQELVENRPQVGEINTQKESLISKLANGLGDFQLGYKENRNNGFAPENLTSNQFAITKEIPNTQLQDYQQELANSGKYTPEQIQAIADRKNSGYKEIDQWIKENPQAFNPTTTETTYKDKSKMGRFGEAVGTVGRIVQNPATQAIVAGGLSTALTGNPLYGLGMAYKFGNGRAMSDIYKNELAKQGVEVDPGMFGSLSSSDMNALMMPQYKQTANDILKARLDESARWHDLMMKYYNDKLNETHDNNVENQNIKKIIANARQTSANASVIKANKTGNGKGGGKTPANKPQNNKDWNKDLAGFSMFVSDSKYIDKIDIARSRFINKYGVDPMKYIK